MTITATPRVLSRCIVTPKWPGDGWVWGNGYAGRDGPSADKLGIRMTSPTPEEITKANAAAERVARKAFDLLEPLAREIRIMGWRPEFQVIMWETVGYMALSRARDVAK